MQKLKFIPLDTLLEMQANNEKFKLVEVLSKEKYGEGHIPTAINIPLDDLKQKAKDNLKKTDKIVVYCASYSCHASTKAAELLLKMGYKNTVDFKGSKKAWVDAGLELEQ